MVQRGKLRVCGIVAAGAGVVFVPADIKAGRGFGGVGHQVMVQRGNLRVGGIVAAGAGVVFVPTFFGTGRGFGGVGFQIMVIGIDFAFFFAHCADGFCSAGCPAEFVRTERTKFHVTKTATHLLLAGGVLAVWYPMVFPHYLVAYSAFHSMLRLSFLPKPNVSYRVTYTAVCFLMSS